MAASNVLLTAANETEFFNSREMTLKAVLFTKKTETPGLWLRLVESFGSTCSFGEVRLAETGLMDKFGISVDSLPRVVAVVGEKGLGREQDNVLPYEGPTDFESLSDFIRDMSRGGVALVQLRREVDEHKREIKGLKVDLEREREAVKTARAEIARSKLGQVGQVEAVKRGLESELQDAREKERTAQVQLQTETHRMEAIIADLEAQREDLASKVKAYEDVQQERVLMLTQNNIDVFLASTTRPLKAVLFTTKSEVPPLWSQLAEAQAMTTAFGVVKHVEDALMERFELDKSDLPRICIWSSEKDEPVVYDGEVKLDALSSFLKDAVHGGDTVIAMRQQVHNAVRQVEDLEAELKRVRLEAAAKEEETERLRAQEAEAHQTQAAQLQAQLQALQQSSESEVSRVSQTARVKLNEAEAKIQTLETELLSERTNMARQMEQLRMQAAADCERERDAWADSRQGEKILEEELTALVKLARRVERTVGRAASAVQVTVVRKDREMERMQRSLREFIDDVAPAQLQAAAYDAAAVRASMPRSHSESSDGIMGAVGVLSQQYKSLKDKINGLDFLGDRMGLDPGPLANVHDSERKYVGTRKLDLYPPESAPSRASRSQHGSDAGSVHSEGNAHNNTSESCTLHGPTLSLLSGSVGTAESRGGVALGEGKEDESAKKLARALAADPVRMQREKKKQARELVFVSGCDDEVSIGQLTREATKTSERNVFTWRNRCLRLLYDGGLRDRLIDDETGSLVYAYPRALELAKAMLKFEHAATPPEGSDTEEKQHENGDDGTAACRLDAQGVEAHRAVAGGGNAAPNRKAGDGKSSLGLSRFSLFRSPKTKKARVPLSSIELDKDADELPEDLEPGSTSTRQLSKSALEKERMPAFIGGMVVLAPPKETAEVLQRDFREQDSDSAGGRWSPRSNSSDDDSGRKGPRMDGRSSGSSRVVNGRGEGGGGRMNGGAPQGLNNGARKLRRPGSNSGDDELGAWGHAPQRDALPVPDIWADEFS